MNRSYFSKRLIFAFLLPLLISFNLSFLYAKKMTIEEKVGQILIAHFQGEVANEEVRVLIEDTGVGGIIYYNWANGLTSPEQIQNLSLQLQKLAERNRLSIPLFIMVDQEGGIVNRAYQGFTIFPGNKALGMTGNSKLAKQCAFAIGKELRTVGINMNLSPVVDINNNPRNPVIGVRSFGDSPDIVVPFATEALKGFKEAGIISSLKHFPGHGDVDVDSHKDLPVLAKSKEQLKEHEFIPFAQLASEADTVMTAHIMVPQLDPENCATLSKKILDILRKELHFKGVIIADSLVMEGVLKNCPSVDEAAVMAFNAGCDMLLLGGRQLVGSQNVLELTPTDVRRIHRHLVEAVKSGRISKKRLDEAASRIMKLKNHYSLSSQQKESSPLSSISSSEHQALAQEIASLSIKVQKNKTYAFQTQSQIAIFAPTLVENMIKDSSLMQLENVKNALFFGINPTQEDVQKISELEKNADCIVFFSYDAWKNQAQENLVKSLLNTQKPLILICLRDPLDASLFPQANFIFNTFSPTSFSIQAVCKEISQLFY